MGSMLLAMLPTMNHRPPRAPSHCAPLRMTASGDLTPHVERRPVPAPMLEALRARFAERCSTAEAVREQHGRGESVYDAAPPEAVVFCETTDDVAFVVRLASAHAVP